MQLSSLTGGGREPANSTTEGSNNLPFSTLFFFPTLYHSSCFHCLLFDSVLYGACCSFHNRKEKNPVV